MWVDFLARERPTGLIFTDDAEYAEGRGFNEPSIELVAPELILDTEARIDAFVRDVGETFTTAEAWTTATAVARRLELVVAPGRTNRVVAAVRDRLAREGLPNVLGAELGG